MTFDFSLRFACILPRLSTFSREVSWTLLSPVTFPLKLDPESNHVSLSMKSHGCVISQYEISLPCYADEAQLYPRTDQTPSAALPPSSSSSSSSLTMTLLGENKGLDESKRTSVVQQQQLNKTEAMLASRISSSYPL